MADQAEMKNHIKGILGSGRMLEDLSAKKVREEVEKKMGMEPGDLKSEKATISALIDECLKEKEEEEDAAGGGGGDEEDEEEEEEEEKPKKGKKRAAEAEPEEGKQPKSTCQTKSGAEAPKNLKKVQESMKMTTKKFLENGPTLEIDLEGNKLQGPPRTFSSGNKGWVRAASNRAGVAPRSRHARARAAPRPARSPRRAQRRSPSPRSPARSQVVHERQGGDTGGQPDGLGAGGHEHHHPRLGGVALNSSLDGRGTRREIDPEPV